MTRALDIFVALIGCLILLMMLPVVAVLIKLESKGPVFFACDRVGRGGRPFKMYKFRTMYETPAPVGASLSPLMDPRVTRVGRVLRRLKINELPQFFNVLKGDMTLIGPRPEALDLAAAYPDYARKIFLARPGLAGPNQILGRNEEEFYPLGVDPVQYYVDHILPPKVAVDLAYLANKSFREDLWLLFLAAKVTITGAISRRHLMQSRGQLAFLGVDALCCLLSFSLAHLLRFDGLGSQQMQGVFFRLLPFVLLIRLPVFFYFNFYHLMVVHFSLHDIREIFKGVALGSVFLVSFTYLSGLMYLALQGYGRGVFVIDLWILAALLIAYRILWKRIIRGRQIDRRNGQGVRRVVIYGAGDAGDLCRRYLERQRERDYEVIGFIDDDLTKMGKRLGGVKVLGDRHHLPVLKDLYQIEEIYVAIHSLSQADLGLIFDACRELALPTYQFQFFTSEYCELPASAYEIAPSPSPSETYKRAS